MKSFPSGFPGRQSWALSSLLRRSDKGSQPLKTDSQEGVKEGLKTPPTIYAASLSCNPENNRLNARKHSILEDYHAFL